METFSVKTAIEMAIKTEKEGVEFYTILANHFSDNDELVQIFSQLSKDETDHEKQFTALLHKLDEKDMLSEKDEPLYLLQATAASEFFKLDILKNKATLTPSEALAKALQFEKSSLLHYITLNETLQNKILGFIIDAEKNHVKNLMKIILSNAQFRGLSDTY